MSLPPGFVFRAPTPDDADDVGAVLVADQLADGIEPTMDAAFMRQVWSRPGIDLTTNAWVVSDGSDRIVGYGQATLDEHDIVGSWGVVHPDARGRGIGTALLDRIEAHAAELLAGVETPRFRHAIGGTDTVAAAMATARGLRPIRHNWHMQIDLVGPVDAVPDPPGIAIGGIDPDIDLPAVYAVLESAFAADPIDRLEPFDVWLDEDRSSPTHDPTLWLVARDGGQLVGALTASAGDDDGWVNWLAVLDTHRGRGIGWTLLRRSFGALAARGVRRVLVNVDAENVTGATAVYERAGMRVANRWDLWERAGRG